jgi:hypothetical protein
VGLGLAGILGTGGARIVRELRPYREPYRRRRRRSGGHTEPPGGVGCSAYVSWQEKNIVVGLAALFVLFVRCTSPSAPNPPVLARRPPRNRRPHPYLRTRQGQSRKGQSGTGAEGVGSHSPGPVRSRC